MGHWPDLLSGTLLNIGLRQKHKQRRKSRTGFKDVLKGRQVEGTNIGKRLQLSQVGPVRAGKLLLARGPLPSCKLEVSFDAVPMTCSRPPFLQAHLLHGMV